MSKDNFDYEKETKLRYQDKNYAENYHLKYKGKFKLVRIRHKFVAWREIINIKKFIKKCSLLNGCKVLDIPCGTGKLFSMLKTFKVYGGDISNEMIAQIPKEFNVEELKIMDASQIPYPDNFFDIVISLRLLHRVPVDLKISMIKEMKRVSNKFIIVSVGFETPLNKIVLIIKNLIYRNPTLKVPIRRLEFENIISNLGLRIKKKGKVMPLLSSEYFYLLESPPPLRILHIITKLEIGGAQYNTIYNVEHLNNQDGIYSEIVAGETIGEKNLMQNAKDRNIKIKIIKGISNNIQPLNNLIAIFRLYKYIKQNKFDIIHTHSSVAGIIGRCSAKIARTKVIIHTIHGWGIRPDISKIKQSIYILLERFCEKFTDKLIVVSKFNIEKGIKYKIGNPSKYIVIHSGIDIKKFSKKIDKEKKRKELGLSSKKIVCQIGRIDSQKNPLDFIRMAEIVQSKFSDVQFIMVGDGALRKPTENLAKVSGINLKILGYRDDVDEILPIIDISVLTSLWEGLPRVLPESMASGKPLVATNVDGSPEAIIDGETGFIVPPNHPELMAEKVLFLLNNPKKAKEMGEKGFNRVNQFSLEKMLKDIDNLYNQLIYK